MPIRLVAQSTFCAAVLAMALARKVVSQHVGGCPASDSAGHALALSVVRREVYDSEFRVHGISQAQARRDLVPLRGPADSARCAGIDGADYHALQDIRPTTNRRYVVSYYRVGQYYMILNRARPLVVQQNGTVIGGIASQYVMFDSTFKLLFAEHLLTCLPNEQHCTGEGGLPAPPPVGTRGYPRRPDSEGRLEVSACQVVLCGNP